MIAGGSGVLSIGALSAATGIPVETIRTWERRYGFPVAERKPSGHRVYPVATVPRLRLINQALARGHRAAEVVPASEAVLEALLEAMPTEAARSATRSQSGATDDPAALFDAVRAFDADTLKRTFQAEWARRGPLEFVEQLAAPLLGAIGNAWQQGELDVRHEHFASAMLGDFLRTVRTPLDDRATGPLVALATLPGERHGLGLQMSALVFALAGWRALMLGIETPPDQIIALTREAPVAAVALSFVLPDPEVAAVRALRRRIAREVPLLVGGAGVTPEWGGAGILVLPDLRALDGWVKSQA
jgi:DNA-binding transcriptional MerR regulator/methanogenic corrinoid protein MtbC1